VKWVYCNGLGTDLSGVDTLPVEQVTMLLESRNTVH
jgi:hypothetical protein